MKIPTFDNEDFNTYNGLLKSERSSSLNCSCQFHTDGNLLLYMGMRPGVLKNCDCWCLLSNRNVWNNPIWTLSQTVVKYVSVKANEMGNCCSSCQTQSRNSKNTGPCKEQKIYLSCYSADAFILQLNCVFSLQYMFHDVDIYNKSSPIIYVVVFILVIN